MDAIVVNTPTERACYHPTKKRLMDMGDRFRVWLETDGYLYYFTIKANRPKRLDFIHSRYCVCIHDTVVPTVCICDENELPCRCGAAYRIDEQNTESLRKEKLRAILQ